MGIRWTVETISACCHVLPGVEEQARAWYERCASWCERNHERAMANMAFGRDLTVLSASRGVMRPIGKGYGCAKND